MDIKIPRIAKSSYAAVYQMTIDDKWIYIGSSVNIRKRLIHWICALKLGKHYKNKNIRQVVGSESKIRFKILEKVADKSTIRFRETNHLSCQKDNPLLLNRCPEGHTNAGIRPYFGYQPPIKKPIGPPTPKKPIAQFDKTGELIATFPSILAAAKSIKTKETYITHQIKGRRGPYKGTIFKFINPDGSFQEPKTYVRPKRKGNPEHLRRLVGKDNGSSKPVAAFLPDGTLLKKFDAVVEAGRALGVKSQNVHAVLSGKRKTVKDLTFKYCS